MQDIYFDLMAEMDFTKHLGGMQATQALIDHCHIDEHSTVLDVGCGVGVTPGLIARRYGCRVVGIDQHAGMMARARERARRQGVADRVTFQVADVRALPFAANTFDAVIGESVLAFVPVKRTALDACTRVARPGGCVGFTEALWLQDPTPEQQALLAQTFDGMITLLTAEGWEALWVDAGLEEIIAERHTITMRSEAVNQLKRAGCRHIARTWWKVLAMLITKTKYWTLVKKASSDPKAMLEAWGYGVFVGKKTE